MSVSVSDCVCLTAWCGGVCVWYGGVFCVFWIFCVACGVCVCGWCGGARCLCVCCRVCTVCVVQFHHKFPSVLSFRHTLVISCGLSQNVVMTCLLFRCFCHSYRKNVRRYLRKKKKKHRASSLLLLAPFESHFGPCWPSFHTTDFSVKQMSRRHIHAALCAISKHSTIAQFGLFRWFCEQV